jgi:hypothetical protein
MKSFRFRLERVLSWRGAQLTVAETKAQQLLGGLCTTNEAMADVVEHRAAAQTAVGRAASISGAELAAFEASRVWAIREEKRLAARSLMLRQSIEVQNLCVTEARRGVKLIERLKARKHESWKAGADHELDDLAAESAIAQWRRRNP